MYRFWNKLGVVILIVTVLSGCDDQSSSYELIESEPTTISVGIDQPNIVVTNSCGPRVMLGYTDYERGAFPILAEKIPRTLVWLSDDNHELVILSPSIETTRSCYVNFKSTEKWSLSPLQHHDRNLLLEEVEIIARLHQRCEAIGSFVTNLYTRLIITSLSQEGVPVPVWSTGSGVRMAHRNDACRHVVPGYTIGLNAETGDESWRIFVSFDQFAMNRNE